MSLGFPVSGLVVVIGVTAIAHSLSQRLKTTPASSCAQNAKAVWAAQFLSAGDFLYRFQRRCSGQTHWEPIRSRIGVSQPQCRGDARMRRCSPNDKPSFVSADVKPGADLFRLAEKRGRSLAWCDAFVHVRVRRRMYAGPMDKARPGGGGNDQEPR
jgi:hypothetical protein